MTDEYLRQRCFGHRNLENVLRIVLFALTTADDCTDMSGDGMFSTGAHLLPLIVVRALAVGRLSVLVVHMAVHLHFPSCMHTRHHAMHKHITHHGSLVSGAWVKLHDGN